MMNRKSPHLDLNPRLPDLPFNGQPPALSAESLNRMISHAVAQPQQRPQAPAAPQPATSHPMFAANAHPSFSRRIAFGSGGIALAASLTLAVILFHNSPANISTGIENAVVSQTAVTPSKADNIKDVSDMLTFDILDNAA